MRSDHDPRLGVRRKLCAEYFSARDQPGTGRRLCCLVRAHELESGVGYETWCECSWPVWLEMGVGMSPNTQDRLAEIESIVELTRTAREKALEVDLTFEAYLLHTALVALLEQLELESQHK